MSLWPSYVLVTVHVGVWPALYIVPLNPSENVVVRDAMAETVLPSRVVTWENPLSS
jgi:hypothetical protein